LSSQERGLAQNCVIVVVGYGVEFFFSPATRPETVSGANPAFCSMGTGVVSRGWSDRSVKFATHVHLVPRSRISGAIPLLTQMPSWHGQRKLYLFLSLICCGVFWYANCFLFGFCDELITRPEESYRLW